MRACLQILFTDRPRLFSIATKASREVCPLFFLKPLLFSFIRSIQSETTVISFISARKITDLKAIKRILTPGDLVRLTLMSRAKSPNKFLREWSSFHEVVSLKGVVVTFRELF